MKFLEAQMKKERIFVAFISPHTTRTKLETEMAIHSLDAMHLQERAYRRIDQEPKDERCILTFLIPMFQAYRNQSIDSQCKSIVWFLYKENIGMKKVNFRQVAPSITNQRKPF